MGYYGYISDRLITKEDILKRFSEQEIIHHIFGFIPRPHQRVCSPLRKDRHPGCWFEYFGSKLYFKDFATSQIIWDCVDLLKDYYKLNSFEDILMKVENISGVANRIPHIQQERIFRSKSSFLNVRILFNPRSWQCRDRDYWSKYGIKSSSLEEDGVFAVKEFIVVSAKSDSKVRKVEDLCYAYTRFPDDHVKLYFPLRAGRGRFLSTCKRNDLGYAGQWDPSLPCLLTKSYKDARVLANLGYNMRWIQSESSLPDKEILCAIKITSILLDNDQAGYNFGSKIDKESLLDAKVIYIPEHYGVKDASDFYMKYGERSLRDLIDKLQEN